MHLSEKLFAATSGGLDIFLTLLDYKAQQLFERGKNFCFGPNDRNPSCSLWRGKDGLYYLTDFGGDIKGGNAINTYAEYHGKDWFDALIELATKYHVLDSAAAKKYGQPEYKIAKPGKEQPEGWYGFKQREFTETDYTTIFAPKIIDFCKENLIANPKGGKYAYTKRMADVMKAYNFIAVEEYSFCSRDKEKPDQLKLHTFVATPEYPIFIYDMGTWAKVYQPFAKDKNFRFMHLGKKPEHYVFGEELAQKAFEDLEKSEAGKYQEQFDTEGAPIANAPKPINGPQLDNIIIATGGSDGMNVAVLGYQVIWANSETGKEFNNARMDKLKKWAKSIYQLPDIDNTGRRAAHNLALEYLDIKTIKLPAELLKRSDMRGKPCKDVKDYFKYYGKKAFDSLVRNALPYRFWETKVKTDKDGEPIGYTYECNNTNLYNFLMANGFYQFKANNGETDMFIKITGNVVKQIEPKMIRAFINNFLEERKMNTELRNVFYRSAQLNASSMENLGYIELEFKNNGKHHQYFFFEDCTYEVSKKGIILHKPGDIDVFTWEEHVIKHKMYQRLKDSPFTFERVDNAWKISVSHRHCLFFRYMENTTKMYWRVERKGVEETAPDGTKTIRTQYNETELQEHHDHLLNRLFTVGYAAHRYKSASKAWAIWMQENQVIEDSTSEGGSGKSILANCFKFITTEVTRNARDPRLLDNKHIFEMVSEKTGLVHVEDCSQYMDFSFFFPYVTGDFDINPKNNKQFSLPFDIAPKIVFTSNYAPRANDGSTLRRLLFTVFSDWYHHGPSEMHESAWKPSDEFGKDLFRDFTAVEWEYFYSTIMHCLHFYLSCEDHEKIDPPSKTVEQRSLLAGMINNFKDWADTYFDPHVGLNVNQEIPKHQALRDFIEHSNAKSVAMQSFTTSLKNFCKLKGYIYNPIEHCTNPKKQRRIVRNVDGKTTEKFYIKVPDDLMNADSYQPAKPTAPPTPPLMPDDPVSLFTGGDNAF